MLLLVLFTSVLCCFLPVHWHRHECLCSYNLTPHKKRTIPLKDIWLTLQWVHERMHSIYFAVWTPDYSVLLLSTLFICTVSWTFFYCTSHLSHFLTLLMHLWRRDPCWSVGQLVSWYVCVQEKHSSEQPEPERVFLLARLWHSGLQCW